MNRPACDRLDDYLDRTLAAADRATFADHLRECSACRERVRECEELDALLRRAVSAEGPVPASLTGDLRRRLHAEQRRRWAVAAVAAALLAVAGAWWVSRVAPGEGRQPPEIADAQGADAPRSAPEPPTRVEFDADEPQLAVNVPTTSTKVTIVWVYPTTPTSSEPDRLSSPEEEGTR